MGGGGTVTEIIGLLAGIVVLTGVSVAIVNGGQTAAIVGALGNTFNSALRTASLGGKAGK